MTTTGPSGLSAVKHPRWGMVDVVYSEDDGGWYCQRFSDDAVTSVFPSRSAAIARLDDPAPFGVNDPSLSPAA